MSEQQLTRWEIKIILEALYAREMDYTGAAALSSREWIAASQQLREKVYSWLEPEPASPPAKDPKPIHQEMLNPAKEQERGAFEKATTIAGLHINRTRIGPASRNAGEYADVIVQTCWRVWQLALAYTEDKASVK